MISVLIGESEVLIREGLKALISKRKDMSIAGVADSGRDLLSMSEQLRPDVVTMDYAKAGRFDMEHLEALSKLPNPPGVLLITNALERGKLFKALSLGVQAILLKECDEDEIVSAVKAANKGEKFFCNKVLDIILEKHVPADEDENACEPVALSGRETEIVELIARGYTTNAIAGDLNISAHTVNTHRKNIMKKLGVKTTAEMIVYAVNASII